MLCNSGMEFALGVPNHHVFVFPKQRGRRRFESVYSGEAAWDLASTALLCLQLPVCLLAKRVKQAERKRGTYNSSLKSPSAPCPPLRRDNCQYVSALELN